MTFKSYGAPLYAEPNRKNPKFDPLTFEMLFVVIGIHQLFFEAVRPREVVKGSSVFQKLDSTSMILQESWLNVLNINGALR